MSEPTNQVVEQPKSDPYYAYRLVKDLVDSLRSWEREAHERMNTARIQAEAYAVCRSNAEDALDKLKAKLPKDN